MLRKPWFWVVLFIACAVLFCVLALVIFAILPERLAAALAVGALASVFDHTFGEPVVAVLKRRAGLKGQP